LKKLTLFLALVAIALCIVPACSKANPNEIPVSANTNFLLPVGKTALLKGQDLSFKFDSVTTDSRCPTGVICVWAGEARCKMLVTQNGKNQEVILTQSGASADNVQAFIGKYQVSFQLSPYPKAGSPINPQDYTLSMKLFQ
jgi:hypothetical protein